MEASAAASGSRRYRSELRDAQAARTKQDILAAAKDLFTRDGFAASSVPAIAQRAGVSTPTVYAAFGSKTALLRGLLDRLEDDADAGAWQERIAAAAPPARPAAFAAWSRALYGRGRDVIRAAYTAGDAAEIAALHAEGDRRRRAALQDLATSLRRPRRTPARVVDQAFVLSAPTVYLDYVDKCGWSDTTYERWLADTLTQVLLP